MAYEPITSLLEHSIGKAGRDLFLSDKDLTIILVPYERTSVTPKAVDEIYRAVSIPFNLIVIEGNAPEEIRMALERRQGQHGNMTIIYTNHSPNLANAFNLAVPHVKTPYALYLDNEMRLPKGVIEPMLADAKEAEGDVIAPRHGLVPRLIRTSPGGNGREPVEMIKTFGLRPCFLIRREVIQGNGKLTDEVSTPYSLGVDLYCKLRAKGLAIREHREARVETIPEPRSRSTDFPLFYAQWNAEQFGRSLEELERVWGIQLVGDPVYGSWLETKVGRAEKGSRAARSSFRFYFRPKTQPGDLFQADAA